MPRSSALSFCAFRMRFCIFSRDTSGPVWASTQSSHSRRYSRFLSTSPKSASASSSLMKRRVMLSRTGIENVSVFIAWLMRSLKFLSDNRVFSAHFHFLQLLFLIYGKYGIKPLSNFRRHGTNPVIHSFHDIVRNLAISLLVPFRGCFEWCIKNNSFNSFSPIFPCEIKELFPLIRIGHCRIEYDCLTVHQLCLQSFVRFGPDFTTPRLIGCTPRQFFAYVVRANIHIGILLREGF